MEGQLQTSMEVWVDNNKKKIYMDLQVKLRNLCEDRVVGHISVPDLIRGVSHNLRGGQPNV